MVAENEENKFEGVEKKEKIQEELKEQEYNFKNKEIDEKLKEIIVESHKRALKSNKTLPKIVEEIKKELDSKVSKGWVVFAGKHMAGSCTFIQGTMVEFEVNGEAFVIFQTFCPE